MISSQKACPFVSRNCLREGCLAWRADDCRLIPGTSVAGPFEMKLRNAGPLMYRSLLELIKVMEDTSEECGRCGPELWNYAQEVRTAFLDELISAELAEAGIGREEG